MLPSRIFTLYNSKANTFLGHASNKKTYVFGFIDHEHAQMIKRVMKYDNGQVERIEDDKYIIKSNPKKRVLKPLDRKNTIIQRFTVDSIIIYVASHNVDFKLIDSIEEYDNNDLVLKSNFYINCDLEVDLDVKKNILQNLYLDRRIL